MSDSNGNELPQLIRERLATEWPAFTFNGKAVDGCAYLLDLACTWFPVPKATDTFFFHFCCCMGCGDRRASEECLPHFRTLLETLRTNDGKCKRKKTGPGVPPTSCAALRKRWIALLVLVVAEAETKPVCEWTCHIPGVTDQAR